MFENSAQLAAFEWACDKAITLARQRPECADVRYLSVIVYEKFPECAGGTALWMAREALKRAR